MKSEVDQDRLAEWREEDKEPVREINPDTLELNGIKNGYFNGISEVCK